MQLRVFEALKRKLSILFRVRLSRNEFCAFFWEPYLKIEVWSTN